MLHFHQVRNPFSKVDLLYHRFLLESHHQWLEYLHLFDQVGIFHQADHIRELPLRFFRKAICNLDVNYSHPKLVGCNQVLNNQVTDNQVIDNQASYMKVNCNQAICSQVPSKLVHFDWADNQAECKQVECKQVEYNQVEYNQVECNLVGCILVGCKNLQVVAHF